MNINEFALINKFRKAIKLDSSVVRGSGDDCAVIKFDRHRYLLFTCDMIVQGVDFTAQTKPELIGRKALAVSLSDIAACGGIPRYATVALGAPRNIGLKKINSIAKGVFSLAKKYKVNIVGGDLSRADKIVLDVSMLGVVEKKSLVLRSNAQVGDIIFVSGALGGSRLGKHLTFTPRIKEARYLVKNFKINSMIDISDGLVLDLSHILEESSVGAVLYENRIPIAKLAAGLKNALSEGEDFELLFTLSPGEAKRLIRNNPFHFKPIGEIVLKKYGLRLIDKKAQEKNIIPEGFQHFFKVK